MSQYNSGTWGQGMWGAFFDKNLNGPFGYRYGMNLPDRFPVANNYYQYGYNSRHGNYPRYNETSFADDQSENLSFNQVPNHLWFLSVNKNNMMPIPNTKIFK